MNDSSFTDPAWQQVVAVDRVIAAFGACFLVGLFLVLIAQIVLVILHGRDVARRRADEMKLDAAARDEILVLSQTPRRTETVFRADALRAEFFAHSPCVSTSQISDASAAAPR